MDPERSRWLAQTVEPALEPDLPIVDCHHHLWSHPGDEYYLGDLRADTSAGHNVVQTVFVECGEQNRDDAPAELRLLEETRWVAGLADESDHTPGAAIAGIVGYVDLRLGPDAVRRGLEAHREAAGGRLVGVRHEPYGARAVGLCRTALGRPKGCCSTSGSGTRWPYWAISALLSTRWSTIPVRRYRPGGPLPGSTGDPRPRRGPSCRGPLRRSPGRGARRARKPLSRPGRAANAHLKLGGIGMPTSSATMARARGSLVVRGLLQPAWGPFLRRCIDFFGPDRCMFESNFPWTVARWAPRTWNAYKRITANRRPAERADLFSVPPAGLRPAAPR